MNDYIRYTSVTHRKSMNDKLYKSQEKELPTYLDGIGEFMIESLFKSNDPYAYVGKYIELYDDEKSTISNGKIINVNSQSLPNDKIKYTYDILFGENNLQKKMEFNKQWRIYEYKSTTYINVINEIKTYISINKPDYNEMIDIGNEYVRVK